ncbi:DNA-binding HxlR family transcriptional regulator [Lipingzhangella halophila]|uniref:DNA-binding HxlR family transcriptional regulator n=1 Tax=Lipingzhangella halophila TaxID=1783352 RepID=A0A7W7RGN8_9ACTN|nr:winged helix-turn-helix transcriptional regulator [Lipingzhangella halophila]MBB4931313.1 DNA-binding HxlR family transcriptional regulator [Lipingzhangella halophila]
MTGKRSYGDPCGIARALDLVGERWALLIVRELLLGPKRFTDLRRGLPTASQNVLSQRLDRLQQDGLVRRCRLGPPAGTSAYELTERGAALEPVLLALAHWGAGTPLTTSAPLSPDALAVALKTTFDPRAAEGLHIRIELRTGGDVFATEVSAGTFAVARGPAAAPDAVIATDAATLRALVFAGRGLDDALHTGDATVTGDREAAQAFLRLFPRPTPTAAG